MAENLSPIQLLAPAPLTMATAVIYAYSVPQLVLDIAVRARVIIF